MMNKYSEWQKIIILDFFKKSRMSSFCFNFWGRKLGTSSLANTKDINLTLIQEFLLNSQQQLSGSGIPLLLTMFLKSTKKAKL